MALTPTLSASPSTGDGFCVFFLDAKNEFYPGGIGSSLGYTNYTGPLGLRHPGNDWTTINGLRGAYVGVGFDIKGNFSNTTDGKIGKTISVASGPEYYGNVTTTAISGASANAITIRGGQMDLYKVLSTTENLSTYPLTDNIKYKSSPAVTLLQTVTSRDDIVFHKVRVSLENDSKRIRIDIQNPGSDTFYPYQVLDLSSTSLSALSVDNLPDELRAGLAFTTSDSTVNCEIKNFTVYGKSTGYVQKDTAKLRPLAQSSMNVVATD